MPVVNASIESTAYRWSYRLTLLLARFITKVFFRVRVEGSEHIPEFGGGLICGNHQSYFDPVFIGIGFDRSVCGVARENLFQWPVLRQTLRWYHAIPIRREGLGLAGLKEVLRRTKNGELIMMFPEGTRSHDGNVGELMAGFSIVAKRTRVPIIPVAVDGAFDVWPRHRKFPRLAKVAVCFGEPITSEQAAGLSDDELVAELTRRIVACHARARELRSWKRLP